MGYLVSIQGYLDVFHIGIFELFFKVGVLLKVLNDFPEVAVIVQPSFLKHKTKHTSVFVIVGGLKCLFNMLIFNLT